MQIIVNKRNITLGEVYVVEKPEIVWTVLGSCVAIILYHPQSGRGAICHAQLPHQHEKENYCFDECPRRCNRESKTGVLIMKYLDCSFNLMMDKMKEMGFKNNSLQAHLFGGSNALGLTLNGKTVGDKNISLAEELLDRQKIKVLERDVLGNVGRKIEFNFFTGSSRITYL